MKCVIKNPDGKIEIHVINKSTVSIGRSKSCDIPILSDSLSRVHCQLLEEDGEIYILDLNSTNGVFINEERIETNQKVKLVNFLNVKIAFLYELSVTLDQLRPELEVEVLSHLESTKTKSINRPETRKKVLPAKSDSNASDIKKNIFMSVLVILGGILFINHQFSESNVETPTQTEVAQVEAIPEKINLSKIEGNNLKKDSTYDLIFQPQMTERVIRKKIKCSDEILEAFCSQKGSLDENEGYFVAEGVLYGYFSFEKEKKRLSSFQWNGDPEDLTRILVLNVFNDLIFQKYEELQISKFKLVIFDSNAGEAKNLIAAVLDYKNSKIVGTDAYYSNASKIQAGDFSDLQVLLDELAIHKF